MPETIKILIVDDDVALCDTLSDILSLEKYDVEWVSNGQDAFETLDSKSVDIMLLDLLLPGIDGIELLKRTVEFYPETAVIMMSGHGTIDKAVEATQIGAYDWLEKPLKKDRILISIQNVVRMRHLVSEKESLLKMSRDRYRMIGVSQAIHTLYALIEKVAGRNVTVLITGESGTGKELVARAIHLNSERSAAPFVEVNCAAIPETLIESELFGHIKGSFTGAINDTTGKFQQAHDGTLFLDEIGDLSLMAQAKILRAIETGVVTRIGDSKDQKVDVRIICATNKELTALVVKGEFREDLFHRINVFDIDIPPLREHGEDIIPLSEHFMRHYCEHMKVPLKKISANAENILINHQWPGNVRELRNFIEKLVVLVDEPIINGQHISSLLAQPDLASGYQEGRSFSDAKHSFERSYILQALTANDWNVSRTAKVIDIPRSLLYRKMEKYGLERGD